MPSMRTTLLLSLLAGTALCFPWMRPDEAPDEFVQNARRGLRVMAKDPELVSLIKRLHAEELAEKEAFFANNKRSSEDFFEDVLNNVEDIEKRATSSCLSHPLDDFYPTNITGLKKLPEAGYPYMDPKPSDQRGPCPGMNTLANHGYIPRNGIVSLAQTLVGAKQLFNMGVDLTAFLAGGSVVLAGDIPSTLYSIGGADARTNSLGKVGGALGTETGLSGHLRFKEGDSSATREDFYLTNGDNHNLNASVFLDLQNAAKTVGGGQYNVKAVTTHFANHYNHSKQTNPYFYFFPPSAPLTIGAIYFIPGFMSNGTIGFGGVANEASVSSFLGTYFNPNGSVTYMPEQIPPQGWYRRGFAMNLAEGIDGIITLYSGAALILKDPLLFGANTGAPNTFTGAYGLSTFGGSGNYGGTTVKGVACAIEQATYADFISEFSSILNTGAAVLNTLSGGFLSEFGCPVPTGASAEVAAPSGYAAYPSPSPCTLNKMQLGVNQCAPDTNTYGRMNSAKVPFCLNNPKVASPAANPFPVPPGI